MGLSYIRSQLHLGGAFPLQHVGGDLTFERESRRDGVHIAAFIIFSFRGGGKISKQNLW